MARDNGKRGECGRGRAGRRVGSRIVGTHGRSRRLLTRVVAGSRPATKLDATWAESRPNLAFRVAPAGLAADVQTAQIFVQIYLIYDT